MNDELKAEMVRAVAEERKRLSAMENQYAEAEEEDVHEAPEEPHEQPDEPLGRGKRIRAPVTYTAYLAHVSEHGPWDALRTAASDLLSGMHALVGNLVCRPTEYDSLGQAYYPSWL